jgi:acyl-CoA thioesterase
MSGPVFKEDNFASLLGIEQIEAEKEGQGIVVMPLASKLRNKMGTAHGGAIFTLVDMAFAAACKELGIHCVTAQCSISYLNPGEGEYLRAEAVPVRLGKTLATFDVIVTDSRERMVAKAIVVGHLVGPLAEYPAPSQGEEA